MITIVTGLPRSGTSLMMQLLEAAGIPLLTDSARQADDSNPEGYYEYDRVKSLQKNTGWLHEAEGKAVKVIIQLLPYLPGTHDYRFLLMQRPLGEVVRSQNRMLERLGRNGAAISLETVFEQQLNRAEIWFRNTGRPVLAVDYHALLRQPESEIKKLTSFLGVTADAEAMIRRIRPELWREKSGVKNISGSTV